MKQYFSQFIIIVMVFGILMINTRMLNAQHNKRISVLVTASVEENPPKIILTWPEHDNTEEYQVYRKTLGNNTWGSAVAILGPVETTYTDEDVVIGVAYEYRIIKKDVE